jgi:predicted nucleotidyltransferase
MDTNKRNAPVSELLAKHRDAILQLAEDRGATNLRIFGSAACGETHSDSDIDFLADFPPNTSIFTVVGLWRELSELLGCEVDLLTDGALDETMKATILQDAVRL